MFLTDFLKLLTSRPLPPALPEGRSGETITFFWQSTLRPVGPFGTYSLNNNSSQGTAIGPTPNSPTPEPVPEPSSLGLLTLLSLFVIGSGIKAKNTCRS